MVVFRRMYKWQRVFPGPGLLRLQLSVTLWPGLRSERWMPGKHYVPKMSNFASSLVFTFRKRPPPPILCNFCEQPIYIMSKYYVLPNFLHYFLIVNPDPAVLVESWSVFWNFENYWVTQKLPQICTVISSICIGKVAWFAVYICGNFWVSQ